MKFKKHIITATVLFLIDAFILNQGIIAAITALVVVFWLLPKSLYLHVKKKSPGPYLVKSLVYTIMVVFIFSANYANNQIAEHRAAVLVTAIESYKSDRKVYPSNLDDLVPRYVETIPTAKHTLWMNRFSYYAGKDQGHPLFFYVKFPPFGRPVYQFETQTWGLLD